jgi:penicillin-binding protein 1A
VLALSFSGLMAVGTVLSNLPKLDDQEVHQNWQTTKIYAADGTLLTSLYYEQDRVVVPLAKISPHLQHAVIAIEDERFYKHKGYDPQAIGRALMTDIEQGRYVEGASTITQQYIKNTIVTREKTFDRKLKEAALAAQLEQKFSKNEILDKYLNTIYFGHSWYGVETASWNFFGKRASDLTLPEAALLAAMIKSPNNFSPYTHPDLAKERRDLVVAHMLQQKYISAVEAAQAVGTPIKVRPIMKAVSIAPYFVEYVKQELLKKYDENVVFKGGLRVYTTIDLKTQKMAEDAAWSALNRTGDPSAAIVAIDPKIGFIRAMVGGRDFNKSKYNLALSNNRQPGSSFKTFVFAAAIENGISPSDTYDSSPCKIDVPGSVPWEVNNYTEGSGYGPMTLREALVKSVNVVFAHLIMDVGPQKVVDLAKKMGITSNINANPAIALGGFAHGPSVLEMANAYATLANGGKHLPPVAITKVTDSQAKLIEQYQPKPEQVISETTAYLVTNVLQDVVRYGTGTRAGISHACAGKTGTATEYRDAWFCGFTPDLAAAVWVGYPQGQIPMMNVHGIRVAGGTFPAQIWGQFMGNATRGTPYTDFPHPKNGIKEVRVCTQTGLLANTFCPDVEYRPFLRSKAPREKCKVHVAPGITEIPNVVGMRQPDAIKALTDAHFGYSIVKQVDNEASKGVVISQIPGAGQRARQNAVIQLILSTGKSINLSSPTTQQ